MKQGFLFLLYIFAAALLYPFLKYYIDSADTLQYITVAKNYSEGNFADAVNSFWSPLISWLLVPFILFGREPVFAFKIVQIIIGVFTLRLIFYHIEQTNSEKWIHTALSLASIPLVLSFAFLFSTPDLLLLTLYLWFFTLLKNDSSPLLIGICGAAMYYAKGFGFAFFVTAFASASLYKFFSGKTDRKKIAASAVQAYVIFFLLCAPWIYFISKKENHFLVSSAGTNAMNLINPDLNPNPFDDIHYPFEKGVLTKPPPHAISAWIYQHRLLQTKWSPFASSKDFHHYLEMIWRNILSLGSFHFGKDAGTVLAVVLILLLVYRKADLKNLFSQNAFLLIICTACTALYSLLMTIHRYVWINDIAIVILFCGAVQELFSWRRWLGYVSLMTFIILLIYEPVKSIGENIDSGSGIYYDSKELKSSYPFGGNVVSLIDSLPDRNHRLSHLVCYYTGAQYYGMAGEHNIPEIEKEKIDYVLDWGTTNNWLEKDSLVDNVISFSGGDFTVYKLKHSIQQTD